MAERLCSDLTANAASAVVRYEATSGKFYRVSKSHGRWRDGAEIGSNDRGYVIIRIHGKKYYAHVLAWLLTYGEYPDSKLFHVNGNTADNRIANLRLIDDFQHSRRKAKGKNNTSGIKGVHWDAERQTWKAEIVVFRRSIHLGRFSKKADAFAAYEAAAEEHHGEFAKIDFDAEALASALG